MPMVKRVNESHDQRVRRTQTRITAAECAALAAGVKTLSKNMAPIPTQAIVLGYKADVTAAFVGVAGLVGDIGDDSTADAIAADLVMTAADTLVPAAPTFDLQGETTFTARVDGGANDLNTATAGDVTFTVFYIV